MRLLLSLFFILCGTVGWSTTFEWDHDCTDTDQFNLYYAEDSIADKYRVAYVSCPATSIDLPALDGYYTVTAANEDDESVFSNEVLLASYYFNSIKYDYEDGNRVIYFGQHADHDAVESDENWIVTHYYYDGSGKVVAIRRRTTSWTNRAAGW